MKHTGSSFKPVKPRLSGTLEKRCRRMLAEADGLEHVLRFLRKEGFTKGASLGAIIQLKGVSLGDAKMLVHFSDAWKDLRQRDERFHNRLEAAVGILNTGGKVLKALVKEKAKACEREDRRFMKHRHD